MLRVNWKSMIRLLLLCFLDLRQRLIRSHWDLFICTTKSLKLLSLISRKTWLRGLVEAQAANLLSKLLLAIQKRWYLIKLRWELNQLLVIRVSCPILLLVQATLALHKDQEMALLELNLHFLQDQFSSRILNNSKLSIRLLGWLFKIWIQVRSRFLRPNNKNGDSRRMIREFNNNQLISSRSSR